MAVIQSEAHFLGEELQVLPEKVLAQKARSEESLSIQT
jgi:hypothetical protein